MNRDKTTLLKYLDIKENEIYTKFPCVIRLSMEEYKVADNDLLDEEDFQLVAGEESSFKIPGTLEIEFPEQGETINLFLPYPINLIKPEDFSVTSKEMIFNFEEGDLIINAFNKVVETNIETLSNLFENRVKYINGFMAEQVEAIWSQLESTTNYRAHHLMLIMSLLYAKMEKDENGNNLGPVLIRHTPEQEYKKEYAISTKDSSHFFSKGAQSTNFGYTNDAIWQSINKDRYGSAKLEKSPGLSNSMSETKFDPNEIEKSNHPENALTYKIAKNQTAIKQSMVNNYTDLENVIAGRYDELIDKKQSNQN